MGFLRRSWLLLAISQSLSQASSASGVVEVDLIFPRNDTFAPSKLTPIVFAIQNPSLVQSLNLVLYWNIEQFGVSSNDSINTSDLFHLSSINYSSSNPYFLYESTSHLDAEGVFQFAWTINYSNCSQDAGTDSVTFTSNSTRHSLYFTTKNGTSQPDLVAATDDITCAHSLSQAWNVTNLLKVPDGKSYGGAPSCAVVPSTTPTPSPCKVKISPTAASSISAALTSYACAVPSPRVSCPAAKNAAPGAQLPVGGAWLPAVFGWLAYTLAWLVHILSL